MLVIGLTGSIGMGKSTVAALLKERGIPVFDADAEVHRLYAAEAVPLIEAAFPGVTTDGQVDRAKLSAVLTAEPARFRQLEAIVHPLVQAAKRQFLHAARAAGHGMAVLEIPLLFETGADRKVDIVIVVSAPADQQRARALQRAGMTPSKLDALLARQMSDAEKRARADLIVDTSGALLATQAQVASICESLEGRQGRALMEHWS